MATMTTTRLTEMVNSTTGRLPLGSERTPPLMTALAECANVCMICADACLNEKDVDALRRCIELDMACAVSCEATGRMATFSMAGDGQMMRMELEHCMMMCRACAEECERHAHHMEHCRICAEACRDCERACKEAMQGI